MRMRGMCAVTGALSRRAQARPLCAAAATAGSECSHRKKLFLSPSSVTKTHIITCLFDNCVTELGLQGIQRVTGPKRILSIPGFKIAIRYQSVYVN